MNYVIKEIFCTFINFQENIMNSLSKSSYKTFPKYKEKQFTLKNATKTI